MIKKVFAAVAVLTLSLTLPAIAQDNSPYGQPFYDSNGNETGAVIGRHGLESKSTLSSEKFYVNLSGGVNIATDSDISGGSADGASTDFKIGPQFHAAFGKHIGDIRFEGEIGYLTNDIDSISSPSKSSNDIDGHLDSFTIMFNGYYDFRIDDTISLYIGGGLGTAGEHLKASDNNSNFSNLPGGTDWVFAYQLMAGVAIQVADGINLDIGYRFFNSLDPSFDDAKLDSPMSHSVEVGVRFDI